MEFEKKYNEKTDEVIYYTKHQSGLDIYVMPKKGYSNSYAIFGTKYGSVDSEFIVPGEKEITKVPNGIAHYLEHKMFDQPDGSNVFDKFSKYGANANAFTSFNVTAYLFSAASNVYENLETLLNYVQSPYFTEESVQKEQGIIGQEIKMYDDSPTWRVFFNFLECLYHNHPVKLAIAGDVESISKITSDYLYKCYNTFYNLSNMTLIVIGDVDKDKALETINKNILKNEPFNEEIKRIYPDEPLTVAKSRAEQKLSVAVPLFMLGFKDTDVGYDGEKLLKKKIEIDILLKMIFAKGAPLYESLYEQGLINDKFSCEYSMQKDYAYTVIEGESKNPQKVYDEIIKEIERIYSDGLLKEDFERVKKVIWGNYIRSHNDIEDYAHTFLTLSFLNIDYSEYYNVYKDITFEAVQNRFKQHFVKENSALSVINPA